LSFPAFAEPYKIEVVSRVLVGTTKPAFVLIANEVLKEVSVQILKNGKVVQTKRSRILKEGDSLRLEIPQGVGKQTYHARVAVGKRVEEFEFDAVVATPLQIDISKADVDLVKGKIRFRASEDVAKVEVEVFGGGRTIVSKGFAVDVPKGDYVMLDVGETGGNVEKVTIVAYDKWGFYNGVEITPFYYEIPHEEVLFDFGKSAIKEEEEKKLEHSLQEIRRVMGLLGSDFSARLYVAGYTDTVGTKEYNLDLSSKRARAIAQWFRNHGLAIEICHQGFGEEVLLVITPDETPEPKNRRSVYVLSNQHPTGNSFPSDKWVCF
jgi:hypothetical protein